MPFRIVDSATRSACAAAANQQAQLEALIAPWAGAPVTARLYTTGGTLLRTITLPALTVAGSPPSITLGSHTGDTAVSTGTPGMWVFSNGATEIFRMDAGLTGALINHAGAVKTGCTPTLNGVVITGNQALPSGGLPPDVRTALMGDSLTTHLLDYNWSPIFWGNGLLGGALKVVANAGISGDTVGDMLARVSNAYTAPTPGLGGLSPLGWIVFRGGTNNARNGTPISSLQSTYTSLLNDLATRAEKVVILSVPPIGPSEPSFATKNALTIEYNTWLASFAAGNPTKFTFVDDSAGLRDVDGSQLAGYFNADGIHNDGRATYVEGVALASGLSSLIGGYAYPSPVSASAADVYPAQPQWVPNHIMAGAGPVATGWSIGAIGGGFTVTPSLVAAGGSDPNQTPWQRVTPTEVGYTGSGEAIVITSSLSGRSVTTTDPAAWDIIVELRFNNFDTRPFRWARLWVMSVADSQPITYDLDLKMGGEASITHGSVVLRFAMPRKTYNAEPSGVSLRWEWATRSAFSGVMGSFDFRCLTVRG